MRRIKDEIEGFHLCLGVAEEDRLKAFDPPERTVAFFEPFLPYAIVLDVESTWAQRFADVLAAAAVAATVGQWYYRGLGDLAGDSQTFVDAVGGSFPTSLRLPPRRPDRRMRVTPRKAIRPATAAAARAGRTCPRHHCPYHYRASL
jgi:hypothetical protein